MKIEKICSTIAKAKHDWETSGGSYSEWLTFFEIKQQMLFELYEKYPELRHMEHFWTWLFSKPPHAWVAQLEDAIKSLEKGIACVDCGELCKYPAMRCDKCAIEHKDLLKERREIAQKIKRKIRRRASRRK
jgi:hypothetical protein